MLDVITDNLDIWTTAQKQKKAIGRGKAKKEEGYGIKKLRELILELAVRGKLVPQDPNDEPASVLLEKIAGERNQLVKEKTIKKPKNLSEITEEEIPFHLPTNWESVRLNDLGEWGAGATPLRSKPEYYGGNIPWFKSGELVGDYIRNSEETITELALKETSVRLNKVGDVLIAMYGATIGKTSILEVPATTNQAVCACTPFTGFANIFLLMLLKAYKSRFIGMGAGGAQPNISREKIIATVIALPPLAEQHRIVAKVDELMALCDQLEQEQADHQATHQTLVKTLLNGLTLRYGSLRQCSLRPFDKLTAQGERSYSDCPELVEGHVRSNTVHPELVVRQAHHVRGNAVHPELVEGSALSPVSSELFEEHFDTLFTTEDSIDQLKQTILQLAVMGKLVPQNPKDEPACILLEKIAQEKAKLIKEGKIKKQKALPEITEDEKPFGLPEGWEFIRLNYLSQLITKGSSPKWQGVNYTDDPSEILFVTSENVGSYKLKLEMKKYVERKFNEVEPRSILMRNDFLMNIVGASIGRTAIYNIEDIANINQAVCLIRVFSNHLNDQYLLHFFNSDICMSYMFDKQVDNARANLSMSNIAKFVIPFPPLAEQHRIVTKVNQLLSLCDTLKANLNKAQTTQTQLADTIVKQAVN